MKIACRKRYAAVVILGNFHTSRILQVEHFPQNFDATPIGAVFSEVLEYRYPSKFHNSIPPSEIIHERSPKNDNFIPRTVRGAESNGEGPGCM